MNSILAQAIFKSHTYLEYRKLIYDLLVEGKSTGNLQNEDLTHYSSLNDTRMNRLDKTTSLLEENKTKLKKLKHHYIWLVISEGWCGDAAQILPILNKMALDSTKTIDLKIVLRDENEELMKLFLTNGTQSIPKLLIIDRETGNFCNDWGPRPEGALNLCRVFKEKFGVLNEQAKSELQLWYLHDKGVSIQNEVMNLMLDLER